MHKDFYSGLKLLLHFPLLSTSFRKAHLHMVYIAQLVRLQTKASLALLLQCSWQSEEVKSSSKTLDAHNKHIF